MGGRHRAAELTSPQTGGLGDGNPPEINKVKDRNNQFKEKITPPEKTPKWGVRGQNPPEINKAKDRNYQLKGEMTPKNKNLSAHQHFEAN